MRYITRALEQVVRKTSKEYPVVLVTGPRQVGKSTLLERMAEMQEHLDKVTWKLNFFTEKLKAYQAEQKKEKQA